MTRALKKSMTYRQGLINGASREYFDPEKRKYDIKKEVRGLIAMAVLGASLIIASMILLNILY